MEPKPNQNCSLCYSKLENEWGNNPKPLLKTFTDRCCDKCNERYVLPTRMGLMTSEHVTKYVSNIMDKLELIFKTNKNQTKI